MKQRLADLGLNQGATIRVLNDSGHGALILAVKILASPLGGAWPTKYWLNLYKSEQDIATS